MAPKTTSPPTKNDAVLGRGGGKNNFRKDSLFRKLIEDNWSAYCDIENFKSADKRAFVKEFVVDPILKQDGRFLKFQKNSLQELLPTNPQDSKELYKRIAQCLRDEKKKNCPSDKGLKTLKDRLAKSPAAVRPGAATKKEPSTPAPTPTPAKSMSFKQEQEPRVVTAEKPAAMDIRRVVFSSEVEKTYNSSASMTLTHAMKMNTKHNDEASFVSMSDSSSAAAAYPRTVSDSSFQHSNMVSSDESSVFSDFDSEPLPIDYQCFRSVSDVFSNLLTWSAAASSGQGFDGQQDDYDHHHVDVDHLPDLAPIPLVDVMVNMNHPHHNHHMKDVFTGYHPAVAFGQDINAGALMEPLCEFDGFPEFCAF